MGLDLRLLPIEYDGGTTGFSHSVLSVDSGRLWEETLEAVTLSDVPDEFHTFLSREGGAEETHYGPTQTTPYGDPIRYARAGDIVAALSTVHERELSRRDRAVIAYLTVLDPRTKIALYWH